MTTNVPLDPHPLIQRRSDEIFADHQARNCRLVDRLFAVLLLIEWAGAILIAQIISPRAWAGEFSLIHVHLYAAIFLGGAIVSLPIVLIRLCPGRAGTRQAVAVAQMLLGALLIHLTGGRIETHFHVFGSLAFLALYRDWRVLLTGSLVVAIDHFTRGLLWPRSIFGVTTGAEWGWLEHVGWVSFEDIVLVFGIDQTLRELRLASVREAEIETTRDQVERLVEVRTSELRTSNGELIREINERSRAEQEAQRARRTAELATRAKSAFLANMSHEIRTPMNGVLGITELLLETDLNSHQRECLGLVKSSADGLLVVINDILDYSKIEAGKLELDPQPFALHQLLEDTVHSLALRAHAKGVELACSIAPDVPNHVLVDAGRLRQILVNLVGNSVKFTEEGEVVLGVECFVAHDGTEMLRCHVSDTGIGIPPEKLQTIFEPFEQADGSMTRRYGGTGLGLAITGKLVAKMGGRITVESALGRGSCFTFTIEFTRAQSGDASPAKEAGACLEDLRVLVVDDNATNRRILEELLSGWGLKPTSVPGGAAALSSLHAALERKEPFALAIIDLMMPEMDGLTLASLIRAEPAFSNLELVMLSSSGGLLEERLAGNANGIRAYLTKPVRQSQLLDAVMSAACGSMQRNPDDATELPSRVTQTHAFEALHILLAEDNLVNQRVALGMLEHLGHSVRVAGNGRQALEMIRAHHFDLVLMDIQMPEMDGLQALRAIRQFENARGEHTPVIALTAHAMGGDRERCLVWGFDSYLSKPVRSELLKTEILRTLGKQSNNATPRVKPTPVRTLMEKLVTNCDNDTSLARELAEMFQSLAPAMVERVLEALDAADACRVASEAHCLKGATLTIGDDQFAAICRDLEQAAGRGDLSCASKFANRLKQSLQDAITALAATDPEKESALTRCES
jgi:signal transduction histidine kinase/DNA-binding response OmpR family regulator